MVRCDAAGVMRRRWGDAWALNVHYTHSPMVSADYGDDASVLTMRYDHSPIVSADYGTVVLVHIYVTKE